MTLKPFIQLLNGESAERAFDIATHEAKLKFGNNGFTGSLADKGSFIVIRCPKHHDPEAYALGLLARNDPRIADMWSPAGMIQYRPGEWFAFGFSAV
jgi:hypothetical protein